MKKPGLGTLGLLMIGLLSVWSFFGQHAPIAWPQPSEQALLSAAVTVLVYVLACTALLWRRRAKPAAPAAGEGALLVVYASQTGHAEQLAQHSADALRAAGQSVELLPLGALDAARLRRHDRMLFVISTTGEGDAPDNAFRFLARMTEQHPLPTLRYGVLALGDRRYQHYCGFGHAVASWLRQQGAQALFETIEVNDGDAAALKQWQQQLGQLAGNAVIGSWAQAEFPRWRLVERRQLNPGSVGGPVHHLAFEPVSALPAWQAGDIAEVRLPQRDAAEPVQQRDYSIASLPTDGRLELLVREQRDAEGRLGRGSGWLCVQAVIGEEIAMQVRSNRSFHLPDDNRPLILIGNGTGLAGLRALLKARAAAGQHRNWLLYGERNAAHDQVYGGELADWQQAGVLTRVDFAWSRDQPERIYVQQRLQQAADLLRSWVAEGAAIYVCGGAQDMAPAVEQVLLAELGAETLQTLRETGRYRRDVY
ncbi:MAG: sulfite reductase subunit alpha [Stagnimonas sp.]|nr:sulfite reductase subunit alpha [Stagnimonas sp.]